MKNEFGNTTLSGKKILLIEDNKAIRDSTAEILKLAGYSIIDADNGKKGVDMAIKESPDLIICDIMMPELDGYGVLHLLNKTPKTSSIPFIFLTGRGDRKDFRKGMEMGADDYLTKPFDNSELLNAIEARLKKNQLLQQELAPGKEGLNEFFAHVRETGKVDITKGDYETIDLKKNQPLYKVGHRPTHLYYICKGKVKVYMTSEEGKEIITTIGKEGDFLGYTALLEDTVYKDSADAMEQAEIMLIPQNDFMSLLGSDTVMAKRFINLLATNLAEKEEQLLNLAYNSLRKRVANGLMQVFDKYKNSLNERPQLEISRKDLAHIVGTATESLIRTLSDFKSEGLIEIKEGKISVLNESKLRNLLN